jgi:anti-anti-sigma factor
MPESPFGVQWRDRQAVIRFPEYVDVSNIGQLRELMLAVINRGAAVLIADMTLTASCDHACVDALARAYQRATVSGTQLRLVVAAAVVRRVLSIEGLDRLVSIYPSVEAAIAAGTPAPGSAAHALITVRTNGHPPADQGTEPRIAANRPALLWRIIDALGDGLALTSDDGEIVLVNRRCAEMFGYARAELVGRQVESLVPPDLRGAHQAHRARYALAPQARPMGERSRLVAVRKDGATIPVEISLTPVPTATGNFTLAVIRDATAARPREDIADLARAAVADQVHRSEELLDRVVHSLFQVGLSLQLAADRPAQVARDRITEALSRLDDLIQEIRDFAFARRGEGQPPGDEPPGRDG